jgi:ufm1-conjugating enzyme 1
MVSFIGILELHYCQRLSIILILQILISVSDSGPRDKEAWVKRLKEEYMSLIAYVQSNKESDSDW